jgi:hypothetical protein
VIEPEIDLEGFVDPSLPIERQPQIDRGCRPVAFDQRMVPATLDEETLVFEVPLHATKAGKHPINGIIRVGYIHGTDEMAMVSLRLIANVTGTE